jgi:hypothetical protein
MCYDSHVSAPTNQGQKAQEEWNTHFISPWREYAVEHRDVFLEEIQCFIRGAGNTRDELETIREATQSRRQGLLRQRGKRGRPRGPKPAAPASESKNCRIEWEPTDKSESPEGWDEHLGFRGVCTYCGDFPHLRPVFLGQILHFVEDADKHELTAIRRAVAQRAKSGGMGGTRKQRGRPGTADDDHLMYQARLVAWLHYADGKPKTWKTVAGLLGVKFPSIADELTGNADLDEKQILETLQRREDYLAAAIWEAVHPNWVARCGKRGEGRELKPRILQHKPAQQWLWSKTGLPFREYPEECKRIVEALFPRGLAASTKLTRQRVGYLLKKKPN